MELLRIEVEREEEGPRDEVRERRRRERGRSRQEDRERIRRGTAQRDNLYGNLHVNLHVVPVSNVNCFLPLDIFLTFYLVFRFFKSQIRDIAWHEISLRVLNMSQ